MVETSVYAMTLSEFKGKNADAQMLQFAVQLRHKHNHVGKTFQILTLILKICSVNFDSLRK